MRKTLYSFFTKFFLPVLILSGSLMTKGIAQQKAQFSQYMFNGLVINPAYAGAEEALSLTFINRNQWIGIENAPTTQSFSAHTLFKQKHFGLGAMVINDKIGIHKNLSALTSYAYHLKTGEGSSFSMGLQAGLHNMRSDYASLIRSGSNDPKLNNTWIAKTFFDFGMGFYFRSPRLHVGLSAPELVPKKISINDTIQINLNKTSFFLYLRYRIPLSETIAAEPSVLVKYLSDVPTSFDLNMNMIFRNVLTLGLSYRRSESIDFLMKAQITAQLQLGYTYDHPIGFFSKLSSGSHEFMVHYLFRYAQTKVSSPR
jgi:type IX secretion system PorP/SprF family membrane protein